MSIDPQHFIQSVVEAQLSGSHLDAGETGPGPVVTLSRDYGSGGNLIATRLAERLHVPLYDKQILEDIAKHAKVDKEMLDLLDDKVKGIKNAFIYSILSGQSVYAASYRRHLINVLLGISQKGGVILGRGAHVVLVNHDVFRVRIIGSDERCAERIAEREGVTYEVAMKKVHEENAHRGKFVWNMFKRRLNQPHHFDLVINTDQLHDWDKVADLIVTAMECAGLAKQKRG